MPHRLQERVRHAAARPAGSRRASSRLSITSSLSETLAPPEDREQRLVRFLQDALEGHDLGLEQAARNRGQQPRDAGDRGVVAVGAAEGVVDEHVSEPRVGGGQLGLSPFVSPALKRTFSSSSHGLPSPGAATGRPRPPARSSRPACTTGRSSSSDRRRPDRVDAHRRRRRPWGRPEVGQAGSASRALVQELPQGRQRAPDARVVGDTLPSASRGTLKSTRTRARFPLRSIESRPPALTVAWEASSCWSLPHQLDHAVRVGPLVVVPGDDLHHALVDHHRRQRVEDRAVRVADDVGGDQRVGGELEDAASSSSRPRL